MKLKLCWLKNIDVNNNDTAKALIDKVVLVTVDEDEEPTEIAIIDPVEDNSNNVIEATVDLEKLMQKDIDYKIAL